MPFQSTLEFASQSDTGLVRAHNEDAIEVFPQIGLAILADGMGGYNAGEIASKMSVDLIAEYFIKKQESTWFPMLSRQTMVVTKWLNDAIHHANLKVLDAAHEHVEYVGMGTTIVLALCHQDKLLVAHVGDSRAYCLRNDHFKQLTKDHSVLQAQIDAGLISAEQAQYSPIKNLITRAVGAQEDLEVEINGYPMEEGDIYLLCSDGLTDMLKDEQIHSIIKQYTNQLDLCAHILINCANHNGGRDNISVVLMKVSGLHQLSLMEHIFAS